MSRQSERLHREIAQIMTNTNCSFIEAILEVCQANQIDPEDIVKQMDELTVARARQCAIDNRMVRKATIEGESLNKLPLE